MDFGLNEVFILRFETIYSQKIGKKEFEHVWFGTIKSKFNLSYLKIPILLKMSLNKKGFKPYLVGGTTVSFVLGAKEKFGEEYLEMGYEGEYDIKDDIKSPEWGYTFGCGLEIPLVGGIVFMEARHDQSFSHDIGTKINNYHIEMEGWEFLIGFLF